MENVYNFSETAETLAAGQSDHDELLALVDEVNRMHANDETPATIAPAN